MRRFLISLVAMTGLVVPLLSVATATPAEAVTVHQLRVAEKVAKERVYGSFYHKAKKKHPKAFNWSYDGCSVPKLVPGQGAWKKFFKPSCIRHDFAYRNKRVTNVTKDRADLIFLRNMRYQCKYDPKGKRPGSVDSCLKAASRFYAAVVNFG